MLESLQFHELDAATRVMRALGAPRAFFFTGEDALRLTSFNSAASVVLTLEGRFLSLAGEIKPFTFTQTPNTDRTTASTSFSVGDGWLLDVQVRASSGTPRVGQCFVLVDVVRGLGSVQIPLACLLEGYVTDTQRRSWPGSALELSVKGRGVLRSITGTNPAANVEITETVPANARWRLLALTATLVADANAANREAVLTLDDGTTVFARSPSGLTQTANQARIYSWQLGAARFTIAQEGTATPPLPDAPLMGGFRISTVTTALQATDNWGAPQLFVEEWIED